MPVTPARVAGVREIVLVSPPSADKSLNAAVLAAARVAGVTEGYRVGGAQAVAALADGTETIRRVDKIVGPGNVYVALAKSRVFGDVGIDMVAGPSEVVVVADDSADAVFVAAGLLSPAGRAPEGPRRPPRAPGPRPRGTALAGAERGRRLPRRLAPRGRWRLRRRAQPRAADGGHGALRLGARHRGFREADERHPGRGRGPPGGGAPPGGARAGGRARRSRGCGGGAH